SRSARPRGDAPRTMPSRRHTATATPTSPRRISSGSAPIESTLTVGLSGAITRSPLPPHPQWRLEEPPEIVVFHYTDAIWIHPPFPGGVRGSIACGACGDADRGFRCDSNLPQATPPMRLDGNRQLGQVAPLAVGQVVDALLAALHVVPLAYGVV